VPNVVSHFKRGDRLKVFEKRVLRRIFGPKSEEFLSWRKLHNDELRNLYTSPNIVRVIKSKRVSLTGGESLGESYS
jgi:hypothetical protein